MRDLRTIKEDNIKRLEMAILAEVAGLEDNPDVTKLLKLAHNYREQIGVSKGVASHKGVY